MPIRIAMPIAHVAGALNYDLYYDGRGDPVTRATAYFNDNGCQGIRVDRDPNALTPLPDSIWDLYAFTDGYLSFQSNSLVLRLPRELSPAWKIYNSGRLFYELEPKGPQLRHVVYHFDADPGTVVPEKIRDILLDTAHPGNAIGQVLMPGALGPVSLGDF